jgi:hypothetical protein
VNVSRSTVVVAAGLAALMVAYQVLSNTESLGEIATLWVSDVGAVLLHATSAVIICWVLSSLPDRRTRMEWSLLALGVIAFTLGDLAWAYLELVVGVDPYPSIADAFYVVEYVFLLGAVGLALTSSRPRHGLAAPFSAAAAIASIALVGVYFALLEPYILPASADELSAVAKVFSVAYPIADVLFMLAPAAALAFSISDAENPSARGWWAVVAGALVFFMTDTWFSLADWSGTYAPGALIDLGWVAAHALFAVGALLARDAAR